MAIDAPNGSELVPGKQLNTLLGKSGLEVWKSAVDEMNFNQLLQLEYITPTSKNWINVFVQRNNSFIRETVRCVLCDTAAITRMASIRQHVNGKKHLRKLEMTVSGLRHPTIDPTKKASTSQQVEKNVVNQSSNVVLNPVSLQKKGTITDANNKSKETNKQSLLTNKSAMNSPQTSIDNKNPPKIQMTPSSTGRVSKVPQASTSKESTSKLMQDSITAKNDTSDAVTTKEVANTPSNSKIISKSIPDNKQTSKIVNDKKETSTPPANNEGISKSSTINNNKLKAIDINKNVAKIAIVKLRKLQASDICGENVNKVVSQSPTIKKLPQSNASTPDTVQASTSDKNTSLSFETPLKIKTEPIDENEEIPEPLALNINAIKKSPKEIPNDSTNSFTKDDQKVEQSQQTSEIPKVIQDTKKVATSSAVQEENRKIIKETQKTSIADKDVQKDDTLKNVAPQSAQTLKDFRAKMGKMSLNDILLVEYKYINTDWRILFETNPNNYSCTMCKNTPLSNLNTIRQHMTNKQHVRNIELVKFLHHPTLLCAKIENKSGETKTPECKLQAKEVKTAEPKQQKNNEKQQEKEIKLPQKVSTDNTKKVDNTKQSTPMKVLPQEKGTSDNNSKTSAKNESNSIPVKSTEVNMTGKNLIKLMKTMEVDELIKIEFRYGNGDWRNMFLKLPENAFKCLLCSTLFLRSVRDLRQHIESVRHQSTLLSVAQLYHPTLAPTKSIESDQQEDKEGENSVQKMKDEEFRGYIPEMNLQQIIKIECLLNGKWQPLISKQGNIMNCNVCEVAGIGSEKSLIQHFKGKRHRDKTELVTKMFHPVFTFAKDNIESPFPNSDKKTVQKTSDKKIVCTITLDDFSEHMSSRKKIVPNPVSITVNRNISQRNSQPLQGMRNKPLNKNISSVNLFARSNVPNISDNLNLVNPSRLHTGNQRQPGQLAQQNSNVITSIRQNVGNTSFGNFMNQNQSLEGSMSRAPNQVENVGSFGLAIPNLMQHFDQFQQVQSRNNFGINTFGQSQSNQDRRVQQKSQSMNLQRDMSFNDNTNLNQPTFSQKSIFDKRDQEIEGLVGVDYVVKILRNVNDTMPLFLCCLCDVEVDGIGMQIHLKGLSHRKKYFERHFPTCMRQLQPYRDDPNYSYVLVQILEKLAKAVEKYHGRDLPFECLQEEFHLNRDGIIAKVFSFRHSSEHCGPSFTNIIDKRTLEELIANRNYRIPEGDPKRKPTFDVDNNLAVKRMRRESPSVDEHRKLVENFLQNTKYDVIEQRSPERRYRTSASSRSPHRSPGRYYNRERRSRSRSRSPRSLRRNQSHSPFRRPSYDTSSIRSDDPWQMYRRMFDQAVEDLDKEYDEYKKDPECHPQYNEEWENYWMKRSKELRAEGRDPSTYNFQPGWVKYFSRRIPQLYEETVEDIRLKLRQRLNLPMHNINVGEERYHIGINRNVRDINDTKFGNNDVNDMADVPFSMQNNNFVQNQTKVSFGSSTDNVKPIESIRTYQKASTSGEGGIETGPLNAVSVLRLLTALEDQLGSLGPKVIDLLAKALTLEKIKPNCADEALLTSENYVFLETVREKLKGQLYADVVEISKLRAVKQALNDLQMLLEKAEENIRNNPPPVHVHKELPKPPKMVQSKQPTAPSGSSAPPFAATLAKVSVPDKQAIASKLASALAAQGKTDFTPEQLEQLVTVYTLIEKKQRESATSSKSNPNEQKKSLSDTLLDLLKPNTNIAPAQENINESQRSNMNSNSIWTPALSTQTGNIPMSRINEQQRHQRQQQQQHQHQQQQQQHQHQQQHQQQQQPGPNVVRQLNFSQLSKFDTSLNLHESSFTPIASHSRDNFSGGFGKQNVGNTGEVWGNHKPPNQSRQFSGVNLGQNQQNLIAHQNRGNLDRNPQNVLHTATFTSTSNTGIGSGSNSGNRNNQFRNNNSSMISYPSNIWQNQAAQHSGIMPQQSQLPMGWQNNNRRR